MSRASIPALIVMASLAFAGAAGAASKDRIVVPQTPSPSAAGLRGQEDAAPPVSTTTAPTLSQAAIGQSRLDRGGVAQSGLLPFTTNSPGLAALGLAPAGDPAPACRAQCAENRYSCAGDGGDAGCDARWTDCIESCSAPATR